MKCFAGSSTPERKSAGVFGISLTYGVIAAAVVAAKLFGHTKEQMANAISLAVASHISLEQIRRGQISHWKGCALANASRNAVFCAMLAAKGMTGPEEAFEGKAGFLSSTGIRFEIRPFADSADTYRIMKARLKAFPAGYFSQSAIEAILNLRSQIPDLDDIKEIRLQTFPAGYEVMGSGEANWQPETRESADHSLPFVMAVALMEGNVEIRHYDQLYYKRSDVRALMQKIKRADRRRTRCRLAGSSLEHCRCRDEVRKSSLDESGLPPRPFQTVDDRRGTGAQISSAGRAAAAREAN